MLDLRIRLALFIAARSGRGFRMDVPVGAMRHGYTVANVKYGLPDPGGVVTRDVEIPTSDDAVIGARLYRRADAGDAALPLVVYFHGGGWVIGDVAGYDHFCRAFASDARVAVLSVDYRLGPEHRFPRAHEDGFDAWGWANAHAAELHADPARIAVGGDSAGGGICVDISAYGPDRGLPLPCFQFLIYPPTAASHSYPSQSAFPKGVPLTTSVRKYFADHYLTSPDDLKSPLYNAIDAPHPERTPPTYLLAAKYDPLVDEGRAYASRLSGAGVPVEYVLHPTLPHGLISFAGLAPAAGRALRAGFAAVATALNG
jgi:acetyl esterase